MPVDQVHPRLRPVWERCAALPGAAEDHPWGETVFKVRGKVFCFFGTHEPQITVKPAGDDLEAMLALPFIRRAAYIGRYGWVTVRIEDEPALDLALELVETTYRGIAGKGRHGRTGGRP